MTTGAFLDYGPYSSFAPCFENAGEIVGQRQLSEFIYQKEHKRKEIEQRQQDQKQPSTSAQANSEGEKDVVMNVESMPQISDEDLNSLLPPEEVKAFKETLGSLELENAVTTLLERNSRALKRLEELQMRRFSEGGSTIRPVEEGSEEWETGARAFSFLRIYTQNLHPFSTMYLEFNFHSSVVTPPFVRR